MNISEIREKYPQYNDLSDEQLAQGLHQKFYSDLPFEDFSSKIGLAAKPIAPPAPAVDPNSSDLVRGFKNYLPQTKEIFGGAEALLGKAVGSEGLLQSGIQNVQEAQQAQQAVSRDTDSFTDAWNKGVGAVLTDWLPYNIGQGAANILETVATAGAGSILGSAIGPGGTVGGGLSGIVGKQLVKKGIKEATEKIMQEEGKDAAEAYVAKQTADYLASTEGRKEVNKYIGATAGIAAQAGLRGTGETTSRAIGENIQQGQAAEDIDLARLLPAAAVHSVADFVVSKIGLNAFKGATQQGSKSLVYDVTKLIATTGAKEVPAEEIQTMAERYGANLSLTDAEALKEYVNTAAASFAMSVAPGVVGGVRSHLAGRAVDEVTGEIDQGQELGQTEVAGATTAPLPVDTDIEDILNNTAEAQSGRRRKSEIARASAYIPGESDLDEPPSGTGTTVRNRVDGTGSDVGTAKIGADAQPTTLTGGKSQEQVLKELSVGETAEINGAKYLKTDTGFELVKDTQAAPPVAKMETPPTASFIAEEEAEPQVIKAIGAVTKEPSVQNYLNKNSYYSAAAPKDVDTAVTRAGLDHADDMFDTVDIKNGVYPAIKQKLAEFNEPQEVKREELRATMEAEGKSPKVIAEALNKKFPIYKSMQDALKFMDMKDIVAIYKENAGKKEIDSDEGGAERIAHMADRDAFTQSLTPFQKLKVDRDSEKSFEDLVKRQFSTRDTSGTDKRRTSKLNKASKYLQSLDLEEERAAVLKELREIGDTSSQTALNTEIADIENTLQDQQRVKNILTKKLSNKKLAEKTRVKLQAELDTLETERAETNKKLLASRSKKVRSSSEEKAKALRARLDEITSELGYTEKEEVFADIAAPKKGTTTQSVYESSTAAQIGEKLREPVVEAVQKAIVAKTDLNGVLEVLADEDINDTNSRKQAETVLNLFKKVPYLKALNIKAKVVFGSMPSGISGKFDPATNTITLAGNNGTYTGPISLPQVLMHETMHYLTDHVTSNRAKYLESIKDPVLRAEKAAALNRLDRNFRNARNLLGHKYNIKSLKEFIAETFSNTDFQKDLAEIKQYKVTDSEGKTVVEGKGISKRVKNLFDEIVRNISLALGSFDRTEYGAPLQEALEDIAAIISVPTRGLKSKTVSYAQVTKKDTPKPREVDLDTPNPDYAIDKNDNPKTSHYIRTMFTTIPGWQNVARVFQNDRYPVKTLQDQLQMANKLISEGKDKINNVYTQIVLSTSNAKNLFKQYVADESNKLNAAVGEFAEAMGMDTKDALEYLHKVLEALHEPERRMTKYVLNVPLSTNVQKGEKRSASEQRTKIIDLLKTKKLNKKQAKELRDELDRLVFSKDAKGNLMYVETQGSSPIPGNKIIDIGSEVYSATGMDSASVQNITNAYNSHEHKAAIDKVIASVQKLNEATITLNKMGNYYSTPVNNFVNFYGWENYVPLKGVTSTKHSEADEMLDYNSKRFGAELQEATYAWEGRLTPSDNPIIQVMSDATRSALRAGRKDLTQAIKNSLHKSKLNPNGQGIINGNVSYSVPFESRHDLADKYKGKNTIFHYNEDGSVDVLEINNNRMLEAIRRTYKDNNEVIDIANRLTSFLGTVHTRYNYNFAPMNFVRDAMTNAWTIGAEMGPMEAARFIKTISAQVAQGGLPKAMKVSYAYAHNDFNKLKQLAKDDPYMADMVEYIEKGGLVSYLQGFSNKSNFEEMNRKIGGSKVSKGWESFNKNLDIWTEMFEISSRSAAYGIKKRNLISQGLSKEAAATEAAAFTKNLANFEQVGELGKTMGAFYMFFRPSATGAVRAIEALAPAWMNIDNAVNRLPNSGPFAREVKDGKTVYKDPQAVADFKKNYAQRQHYARLMSGILIAAGGMIYLMSAMASDEDELGRNSTLNDNMSQWTRFMRFHMKNANGDDTVVQMPWGFGLGALASIGAQLSAVSLGRQSAKDAFGNMFQIGLDSFIPLPVSRMSPTDAPLNFIIDSIMPSVARPIVEFALNKNGLGQDIYNDSNRRMGDAYTGGDKIPQIYKDLAIYFADESNGGIDVSPNTLYFLSNSYADGFARVLEEAQGIYDIAGGQKEFNAKTDLPLFGSFFGSKANVDSMEFTKVENIIKEKERRMKMFEDNPVKRAEYMVANPMDEYIVEAYNNAVNGTLKDLRAQANEYRRMQGMSQKDKADILKVLTLEQNIVKRNMIDTFKAYGVEY